MVLRGQRRSGKQGTLIPAPVPLLGCSVVSGYHVTFQRLSFHI